MKVTLQFPKHHYVLDMQLCKGFCVLCGAKELWEEARFASEEGENRYCAACGYVFCYTSGMEQDGVIRQLRSGVQEEPTEERGG